MSPNHAADPTLKTSKLVTLLLLVLACSLTIGTLTSVVSTNGLANATTTDGTDSQVGLGFSTTPGPTKAPSPTPTQSSPVIPDPHDPPTTEQTPVNVGANLAKTGWINIQIWLLAFGLLGGAFLFWAFLLVRRERDEQEEDGLVIVAKANNKKLTDSSNGFGEDK